MDDAGQITEAHSISAGLDYPGIGPEHSWLHEVGRVTYLSATDEEALEAFQLLSKLEGIIPALEAAHALARAAELAPKFPREHLMVVNLSGRGDKDVPQVARMLSERKATRDVRRCAFRTGARPLAPKAERRMFPPISVAMLTGLLMTERLATRFEKCRDAGRAALVTFVTAGDPDHETSLAIVKALPAAGADIIELGMPFTDPMADGPAVQAAGLRALEEWRDVDEDARSRAQLSCRRSPATPIVLMGYYNPIYVYGVERFLTDAKAAGVDGLIVVDLPPEEDEELCLPALKAGLAFIRLATPTTDDKRLPTVLRNTAGFVYYVSITGVTGAATPDFSAVAAAVARIKRHTSLPVAVGFGVKTPDHAAAVAACADAVVVGSSIVDAVRTSLDAEGRARDGTVAAVTTLVRSLAEGVARVRKAA